LTAIFILISIAIVSCIPKTLNLQITIDGIVITDLSQVVELFSEVHLNNTITKDITLKNIGDASLTIENITITNISNAFTLILTNLPPNTEIIPEDEKTFTVRFIPTTHEIHTADISILTKELDNFILKVEATTLNNDANLSALTLSAGALDPVFNPNTLSYDAGDVGTSPIDVIATTNDANATLTINGNDVTSGVAESVALTEGANTITIVVTAEDGTATKTYEVAVNKTEPSNDANLSGLTLSAGTLDPVFNANTISYNAGSVTVSSVNVTATTDNSNATLTINGTGATSGIAKSIPLNEGSNTITILVTAEDTTTTKTYTITINKITLSNNANLSALTLSTGTLNPTFSPSTISYNAGSVTVSSVNVTATTDNSNATLTINGTGATSGIAKSIPLNEGSNTITIIVTAENTTTTKTYTVSITKTPAGEYSYIVTDNNDVELGGFVGTSGTNLILMTSTGYIVYITYDGDYVGSQLWYSGLNGTGTACLNDGTGGVGGIKMCGKTILYAAHNGKFYKPTNVNADGTSTSESFHHLSIVQANGSFYNDDWTDAGWILEEVTNIGTEFGIPSSISIPLNFDAGSTTQYVKDNNNNTIEIMLNMNDRSITVLTSTSHIVELLWNGTYKGSQIWYSGLNGTGIACLNDGSGGVGGLKIYGKMIIYATHNGKLYKPTNVNSDGTSTSVAFTHQSIVQTDGTINANSDTDSGWLLTEVTSITSEFGLPSSITAPIILQSGATIPLLKTSGGATIGRIVRADMYGADIMTSNLYQAKIKWTGQFKPDQIYFSGDNATGNGCLNDGNYPDGGLVMYGKTVVYSLGYNSGAGGFFKPTNVTNGISISIQNFNSSSFDNYGNVDNYWNYTDDTGWLLTLVTDITVEFSLPASITTPLSFN